MALQTTYQLLEPRAESNYRQLFVCGNSLRAGTLYRATIGAEPRTPEEVAADFGVPLAVVHEAVHYCLHNEELLRQEREAVLADIRARGLDEAPMDPSIVYFVHEEGSTAASRRIHSELVLSQAL